MTSKTFITGTVIDSAWLNDVNAKTYADTAANVPNVPAGTISATDVQAAITELDTEKASSTALAASGGSALLGHLPSGTGAVATTVQAQLRKLQALWIN